MISTSLLLDCIAGFDLLNDFNCLVVSHSEKFFFDSHPRLAHIACTAMTPHTQELKMTKTRIAAKPSVLTVAQYAKQHKMNPKVVRRALRAVATKPAKGWVITPALARKLAA